MILPKNRIPTHPGEVLNEEFLKPLGLTQVALAAHVGVPVQRINELVRGKRVLPRRRPGCWPELSEPRRNSGWPSRRTTTSLGLAQPSRSSLWPKPAEDALRG